jgi:hypothetical protein
MEKQRKLLINITGARERTQAKCSEAQGSGKTASGGQACLREVGPRVEGSLVAQRRPLHVSLLPVQHPCKAGGGNDPKEEGGEASLVGAAEKHMPAARFGHTIQAHSCAARLGRGRVVARALTEGWQEMGGSKHSSPDSPRLLCASAQLGCTTSAVWYLRAGAMQNNQVKHTPDAAWQEGSATQRQLQERPRLEPISLLLCHGRS